MIEAERDAVLCVGHHPTRACGACWHVQDGLVNIERGTSVPKPATLSAIERVLTDAGIEFLPGDDPGVRLRRAAAAQ